MADSNDAIVDEAIAACAQAWPGVRIDRELVADKLRGIDLAALDRRHLADLCLAWTCLTGDAVAQRTIDTLIRTEAQRAVTEMRKPAWLVDEVQQELAQRLLMPSADKPPRLATYAGQSALGRWLGVAATRALLNLIRRDKAEGPVEDANVAAAVLPPELAIVRDRYRSEVEEAIRAAFASLEDPRDRNLLRLYYFERLGLEQLGKMFGVHGSTVSRWLTTLRETIIDETRNFLAERLGLAGNYADVDSLIRAVQSDLDLTLSRMLKAHA